jgi:hypothetical protein
VRKTRRAAGGRLLWAAIAASAVLSVGVQSAAAATVTHDPLLSADTVTYAAAAGESNQLSVSATASDLVFTDAGTIDTAPLLTGDCTPGGQPTATCPIAGVTTLTITRIETGRHEPRVTTARQLAEALGVSPAKLSGYPPDDDRLAAAAA